MFDLRSIVIGFVLMLKKYTCINITIHEETNGQDYKNGIIALPLIGLAIGLFAFVISAFRYIYDGFFISSVVLLYYCIITKTVNIKDSYRTFNYYLDPSSDTREQTWGIISTVIICLIYFSLFRIVPLTSLIIMPAVGFSCLIILSRIIKSDLNNTSILKHCEKHHVSMAFIISFCFAVILNYKLVISLSLTYMMVGMLVSVLNKKVKNVPPSIEGFIIEISQILFLSITYLFKL